MLAVCCGLFSFSKFAVVVVYRCLLLLFIVVAVAVVAVVVSVFVCLFVCLSVC